jgi:predicted transcriptional regulator
MKDVIKETQLEHDIKTRSGVFERFNSGDDISVSLIQRKCKCGYFSASRVLENLIDEGLVERTKGLLGLCTMV